jgi:hypothetical protein
MIASDVCMVLLVTASSRIVAVHCPLPECPSHVPTQLSGCALSGSDGEEGWGCALLLCCAVLVCTLGCTCAVHEAPSHRWTGCVPSSYLGVPGWGVMTQPSDHICGRDGAGCAVVVLCCALLCTGAASLQCTGPPPTGGPATCTSDLWVCPWLRVGGLGGVRGAGVVLSRSIIIQLM